jgi:hypothetical protein
MQFPGGLPVCSSASAAVVPVKWYLRALAVIAATSIVSTEPQTQVLTLPGGITASFSSTEYNPEEIRRQMIASYVNEAFSRPLTPFDEDSTKLLIDSGSFMLKTNWLSEMEGEDISVANLTASVDAEDYFAHVYRYKYDNFSLAMAVTSSTRKSDSAHVAFRELDRLIRVVAACHRHYGLYAQDLVRDQQR